MANNDYSWNQTLKFSWCHIIAFVALIFISYVTYMGDFYQNGGDFKSAAIKVCAIDAVLLITFLGAQIYKGTDEKFGRSILIERILICLCPIAFIWAMIPYNHFWNVFSEKEQIESLFNTSIQKSRQIFLDYDKYSNDRIIRYENTLDNIIRNKTHDQSAYVKAGFNGNNDEIVKGNYIETLRLQLLSENTDSLRKSALAWIDKVNQSASVWNAFLIGNVENISNAIKGWNEKLSDVSKPVLSNETFSDIEIILPFDENKESVKSANDGLISLRKLYTDTEGLSTNAIWSSFLLFLMMLLPYFHQRRNEKAKGYYSLIPTGWLGHIVMGIEEGGKTADDDYSAFKTTPTDSSKNDDNTNNEDNPYEGTF